MSSLTVAEKEVLTLMATGLTNRQIATLRQSSESTIKNQINAIYRKSSFVNRNEVRAIGRLGRAAEGGTYGPESYQPARP